MIKAKSHSSIFFSGRRMAFTLIELLIVVAIISILAAIAIPNYLEAQVRAKVARAASDMRSIHTAVLVYQVDNNTTLRDSNDTDSPFPYLTFYSENPGVDPDVQFLDPMLSTFYVFRAFHPLTTPISYMSSVPGDPFSRVMPYGLETREVGDVITYCVMFSCGPDRTEGDWLRFCTPTGVAIPYDASNGTVSRGDVWRMLTVEDLDYFRREFAGVTVVVN